MTFAREIKNRLSFSTETYPKLDQSNCSNNQYMQLLCIDIFIFYISVYMFIMVHCFCSCYCILFLVREIQ